MMRQVNGIEVCPHGLRWSGLVEPAATMWCAECEGAAVAFGLIGLAEAIRTRHLCPRHGKLTCWECFWVNGHGE